MRCKNRKKKAKTKTPNKRKKTEPEAKAKIKEKELKQYFFASTNAFNIEAFVCFIPMIFSLHYNNSFFCYSEIRNLKKSILYDNYTCTINLKLILPS